MVSSTDFVRASERTTAIATLNRQRHLTPSCGGFTPTAERTVGPARMIVESLTARPGIREQYRHLADIEERSANVCFGLLSSRGASHRQELGFDPNRMCLVMPKLTRMSGDVTFFRLPKDATAWTGF